MGRFARTASVALVTAVVASGCTTVIRSSVSSDGAESNGASADLRAPVISDTGRFVSFVSSASNLVQSDTNGTNDVFRHDNLVGGTTRVSVEDAGAQVAAASDLYAMSGDGAHVGFGTAASLESADTNHALDIYVRSVDAGTTERVTILPNGEPIVKMGQTGVISHVSLSDDGRYILMVYSQPGRADTYIRDRQADTTTHVATWALYAQLTGDGSAFVEDVGCGSSTCRGSTVLQHWMQGTSEPVGNGAAGSNSSCGFNAYDVTSDGRYVLGRQYAAYPFFACAAPIGLVRWDTVTKTAAAVGDGTDASRYSLSDDGRLVAYRTGTGVVKVVDVLTGVVQRADTDFFGQPGDGVAQWASLADGGRFLVLGSPATNLVPGDSNGVADVFTRFSIRPTVSWIAPGSLARGATHQTVQVHGSFLSGLTVTMGDGVTVHGAALVGPDLLSLDVSVAPDAPAGAHDVMVTNLGSVGFGSGVCLGCLTVT